MFSLPTPKADETIGNALAGYAQGARVQSCVSENNCLIGKGTAQWFMMIITGLSS